MGQTRPDPVVDRLRTLEQDLVVLRGRLDALALGDLLEHLGALRSEVLAIGFDLARTELVAACEKRDSSLDEPADLVELVSCLGGR